MPYTPSVPESWKIKIDGFKSEVYFGDKKIGFIDSLHLDLGAKDLPKLVLNIIDPGVQVEGYINPQNIASNVNRIVTCPDCNEVKIIENKSW